jgi:uncharacterized protein YqgC (DUF456 family)
LTPLEAVGLTVFILVLFLGMLSILFGLPGTIIILLAGFVYSLLTGFDRIGLKILFLLAGISLTAELLEFYLGVRGAAKFGASKSSIAASLVGAFTGALLMTPFLLGLGTLLGAFLGGFFGTFIVEIIRRRDLKPAMRASYGAVAGRVAGIFVKGCFALIMIVIILSAVYS